MKALDECILMEEFILRNLKVWPQDNVCVITQEQSISCKLLKIRQGREGKGLMLFVGNTNVTLIALFPA